MADLEEGGGGTTQDLFFQNRAVFCMKPKQLEKGVFEREGVKIGIVFTHIKPNLSFCPSLLVVPGNTKLA